MTATLPLSRRESEVANLIADGLTNAEIAAQLGVSPETIKTYASRLFRKLGARNRAQVATITTARYVTDLATEEVGQ